MNRPTDHAFARVVVQALPLKGGRPVNHPHEPLCLLPSLALQQLIDIAVRLEIQPNTQDTSHREHGREARILLAAGQDSADCRQRDATAFGQGWTAHAQSLPPLLEKTD